MKLILILVIILSCIEQEAIAFVTESNFLLKKSIEKISIPIKIAPHLVDAPPRYINLLPVSKIGAEIDFNGHIDSKRISFSGIPIDLNKYPILKFESPTQKTIMYGLEFDLDTSSRSEVDTLIRIGSPVLFKDMLSKRIDLNLEQFTPKGLIDRIKSKLNFMNEKKWLYSAIQGKVNIINKGEVSATLGPRGGVVIQSRVESTALSKTPWLKYEFEMPDDLRWTMHINVKVETEGNFLQTIVLSTESIRGSGKQKILINMLDLLQKNHSGSNDGKLKEIYFYYELDEPDKEISYDVNIKLGNIEFYDSQVLTKNGKKAILVSDIPNDKEINLLNFINKKLGLKGKLVLQNGSLIGDPKDLKTQSEDLPGVSFSSDFKEKIPELFIGDQFFLKDLSSSELNQVLDHKIFYSKNLLWQSGKSDVIFKNSDKLSTRLVSFSPNIRLNSNGYIYLDFSSEDRAENQIQLTISGIDFKGNFISNLHHISRNMPIRVKNIRLINKLSLSYSQAVGTAHTFPASIRIKNLQIFEFKKENSFQSKPLFAYTAILPIESILWKIDLTTLHSSILKNDNKNISKVIPVEVQITGNAKIKYKFETSQDRDIPSYLRIRGFKGGRYINNIFPINMAGELLVTDMYISDIEIFIKNNERSTPASYPLMLRQLEIVSRYEGKPMQGELLNPMSFPNSKITYFVTNYPLNIPALDLLKPNYVFDIAKNDLRSFYKIDASLSYAQIINGGKNIFLPQMTLQSGEYWFSYIASKDISLYIRKLNLQKIIEEQYTISNPEKTIKTSFVDVKKIGLFLLSGVVVLLLGFRYKLIFRDFIDKGLTNAPILLLSLLFLLFLIGYLIFIYPMNDNATWIALLTLFAYGLTVRYKLRSFLAKRWIFFQESDSAPYFLLFLVLVLISLLLLTLGENKYLEHISVFEFFLFLLGTFIELYSLVKNYSIKS